MFSSEWVSSTQSISCSRSSVGDAPVALLLVRQRDAVALERDPLEQVPVVVQGRVDVQRDPGHGFGTVGDDPHGEGAYDPADRPSRRALARRARAGDDYGVTAEPDWREVDWRAHLHQAEIDGRDGQLRRHRLGASCRPVVFVHGLGGCWQNLLENIPRAAQERRVIALDLPGLRLLGDAARGGSRSPATPDASKRSASGSASARSRGRQLDGRLHQRRRSRSGSRPRVERLVLVSAAGISNANVARAPALTLGRVVAALSRNCLAAAAAAPPAIAGAALARASRSGYVIRHPSRLARRPRLRGADPRHRQRRGFLDALGRASTTTSATACRRSAARR